jgi:hypothetical protein
VYFCIIDMEDFVGRIYKISSASSDKVYIGSTRLTLDDRLKEHHKQYKRFLAGTYHNVTSFELLRHDDAVIELLSELQVTSIKELERLEGLAIKDTPNCVNKIIVGRSRKEYYVDNKEHIIDKAKGRYEAKKDIVKAWQKTKCVCDVCGKEYTLTNKARHYRSQAHLKA